MHVSLHAGILCAVQHAPAFDTASVVRDEQQHWVGHPEAVLRLPKEL